MSKISPVAWIRKKFDICGGEIISVAETRDGLTGDSSISDDIPVFAIPDTHCIVPKEPDEKMCQFALGSVNANLANAIYKAMITAYQEEE